MKGQTYFLATILSLLIASQAYSQCTTFLNGPFPLPEYDFYNCGNGNCDMPEPVGANWQPGDGWELLSPNMLPGTDYFVDFGVDPATIPFAGNLEVTVYDAFTLDVVAFASPGLNLFFQLPDNGVYILTISEIGNCGIPSTLGPFMGFEVDALCPLACPMDRLTAVNILLSDPDLVFDPTNDLMMCPFVDYGAGPGFEGLLPPGTEYGAALNEWVEIPLTPKFMDFPSYLFYLDPQPGQMFEHDVEYYIVDALHPAPSILNGGIQVCPTNWWPYIIPAGTTTLLELFGSADDYYTDDPVGPSNPEGLAGGDALPANFNQMYMNCPPLVDKPGNKCALVFSGFAANRAKNSVKKNTERINMTDCYDKDNITSINNATEAQICTALDNILAMDPACSEICIYVIAHGIERADGSTVGGFGVNGGMITPNEWQAKMDSIAKKGIVTHITFETCRSTAIGNPFNWKLPNGSTVTFASASDKNAWAYTYKSPACDTINEGIFTHAIAACRTDVDNADLDKDGSVSYKEGVKWVIKSKPCYSKITNPPSGRYPAGPPPDSAGYDPGPSFVCIGATAASISKRYKMPAGFNPEKVCIVLSGKRTTGTALVYTSNGNTFVPHTTTKTYNAARDETEICYIPSTPFTACVRYWFHYYDNSGNGIRVKSAIAKECPPFTDPDVNRGAPPLLAEYLPTTETETVITLDGSQLQVTIFNRGVIGGGIGQPVVIDVGYRISDDSIPFAELNLGHASYTSLTPHVVDTSVALDTNDSYQFYLDMPQDILPGQYLMVETNHTWSYNATETRSISQFDATGTFNCVGDTTYTALSIIPELTNSGGNITLDSVLIANDTTAFNAGTGIDLINGTEIPIGKDVIFYILGCLPN